MPFLYVSRALDSNNNFTVRLPRSLDDHFTLGRSRRNGHADSESSKEIWALLFHAWLFVCRICYLRVSTREGRKISSYSFIHPLHQGFCVGAMHRIKLTNRLMLNWRCHDFL